MNYTFDNFKTKYSPLQLYTAQEDIDFLTPTKYELNKPIGYRNIHMRTTQMKSKKNINTQYLGECSQLAYMIQPNKKYNKQQKSALVKQQRNYSQFFMLNTTPNLQIKQIKRPVSSYQNIAFNSKQNKISQTLSFKKSKIKPIKLGQYDMQSLCQKMSQSIILSSDTAQSQNSFPQYLKNDFFQRIKLLGKGKYGQVYLVKHKKTGFICALKIITKRIIKEQGLEAQIAKQLRIHNKLKSQNIIDFYGFFDDIQNFYILLQFATQGSVFCKLRGKSHLEENQLQPIAKGLCDGLRLMHLMGYIHRDIKPDNIVLQFGVPKICDFGWATECDQNHLCKSYCGTPLYLSPQMIKKQKYGSSVDIWAAGLVVYQLLVGRVPFRVWNQEDMSQIITRSLEFPQYIDRSSNCQSFIRGCLQKKTYNRMSIAEVLRHPFISNYNVNNKNFSYEMLETATILLNSAI